MKIEDILPEIRKGRRFKRNGADDYITPSVANAQVEILVGLEDLMADDWELEPDRIELAEGSFAKTCDMGYVLYLDSGTPYLTITHDSIEKLYAASTKARGQGIPQDTQQFTGVDPNYREYVELTDQEAEALFFAPDPPDATLNCARRIHRAGWDARESAQ